jgi:hypothetical protein
MRLVSIAIVIFAGIFLIAIGMLGGSLRENSVVPGLSAFCGFVVVLTGVVMFFVEWIIGLGD